MKKIPLIVILLVLIPFFVNSNTKKAERKIKKWPKKAIFLDVNPHISMFKDGKVQEEICLFCHSYKHTSDPKLTGKRDYLNAKVNELCSACHGLRPHAGAYEHSVKPSPKIMKRIKIWEGKNKKKLRFDTKGRVTCSTCHNPHPKGLLKTVSVDVYAKAEFMKRYSDKGRKGPLYKANLDRNKREKLKIRTKLKVNSVKLPFRQAMEDGKFCKVCHELK